MRLTHALVRTAQVLAEDPDRRHWGYDLYHRSGVRSGVIYPILIRMLKQGWLIDGWEHEDGRRPRRYYTVTDTGRTELAALLERARADRRFQNI